MWLAVDCGNTRVKWAAVEDGAAGAVRAAAVGQWDALARAARGAQAAWVSHSGGAQARAELSEALGSCSRVHFLRALRSACGVRNAYHPPGALGVDRWLSLLAAREEGRATVVVNAGTAACIDVLQADGVFAGGFILPGASMMIRALREGAGLTAAGDGMQEDDGSPAPAVAPRDTRSAMREGARLAIAGAALEARRRLAPRARLVASGGDAAALMPLLPASARHVPHLPIRGILRMRGASAPS